MKHLFLLFAITFNITIASAQKIRTEQFNFQKGVTIAHWTDYLFEGRTYGDPKWFSESDVEWLFKKGFDHIQIRIEGSLISNYDLSMNEEKLSVLNDAISWTQKRNMGVILTIMTFPEFKIDTTLSKENQENVKHLKQMNFIRNFTSYFKNYKNNVRFVLYEYPAEIASDASKYNEIMQTTINEVRKIDKNRHLYFPIYNWKTADKFYIKPKNKNISIAFNIPSIYLFYMQFAKSWYFTEDYPIIKFPFLLPDLTKFTPENSVLLNYSNKMLDSNCIQSDINNLKQNLNKSNVKYNDLYILGWGYYREFPFNPESEMDKISIQNYGKTMTEVCKTSDVYWSIYDYNSGMAIRDSFGNSTEILKAIEPYLKE